MKFWVVFSKEFIEIIRDRRRFALLLLSTFVLMPLLFIVPYAVMILRLFRTTSAVVTIPVQGMENAPALVAYLAEEDIQAIPAQDVESLVLNRQYPAGLIIPADYEERLAGGLPAELIVVADLRRSLDLTHARLVIVLEKYGDGLLQERLRQQGLSEDFTTPLVVTEQNAATTTETAGSMLGLLIPGVILSFGLGAGMPVAISTVAGEKKKLTLEPVLCTTVSRLELVLAKYLAVVVSILTTLLLMALSLVVSGVIVTVFLLRDLPVNLLQSAEAVPDPSSSATQLLTGGYHLEPLAILLFLLAPLLIIMMSAAIQVLVSTWARNDDEASTYLTPLNYLSGAVFLVAFFLDEFVPQLWHYGIPVFGTILSMRDLLSNRVDPASLAVMFLASAFFAALMLALAVWMFHREEVVFRT